MCSSALTRLTSDCTAPGRLTRLFMLTECCGSQSSCCRDTWQPLVLTGACMWQAKRPVTDASASTQKLSWAAVGAIVGLKALGYWVFRGSNGQKNTFRQNPEHTDVRHLETLRTASGRRLLVSGWWGVARHINYFGDWLMA